VRGAGAVAEYSGAGRSGVLGVLSRVNFLVCLAALAFLMYVAYRGHSVILFAPVAAMAAVLLTDPAAVPPMFSGVFMDKMSASSRTTSRCSCSVRCSGN